MTYDGVGNPLTYYNGSSYSFTWEEGRQLASVTTGNNNTYTYKYNQDGVRIEKTVGTLRYEYTVSGTRIEREKLFDGSTLKKDSYFYYDASGIPCSAKIYVYNGTSRSEYNLILESNIQGDITEIYTSDGTLLVSYTYGAWGQIHVKYAISDFTLSNLAIDVPFKYRGYYHDQETGFYYLNSRYYDPYMMRFINADDVIGINNDFSTFNLYAYCGNNPVNNRDTTGQAYEAILKGWLATGWTLSFADGPYPVGEAVYLGGAIVIWIGIGVLNGLNRHRYNISTDSITDTSSSVVESEKDEIILDSSIETESNKNKNEPTYIYRYGTCLYPEGKDVFTFKPTILVGLSFSLDPPKNPNTSYYVTTMEQLNNSGIFIAINDRDRHVTVMPTGIYGSVYSWYDDKEFHNYTFALRNLCVKMN